MQGTRGTNTFVEGLQKLLGDLADLKVAPDADLDFIYQMETTVLQKIRAPQDQLAAVQAQQAGQGGMPSAPPPMDPSMAGAGAGMGGGAPPMDLAGAMAGSGGGAPGQRMNPQMPSGDELRRLLGQ